MKNFRILLILSVAIVFASSCRKEEMKDYYTILGIIKITTDSTIIITDADKRFLVVNRGFGPNIKNNDRVIAEFTLVDKTLPPRIDKAIEITAIESVLFKPVIELTTAIEDSIGNDELEINSIWLAKDYMNLNFSFYGGGGQIKHYINLIRNQGIIPTDTIDLEIRHNQKGDYLDAKYYGFVSFDLISLQNNLKDSVTLRVKAIEYNNRTFQKYFTYKY